MGKKVVKPDSTLAAALQAVRRSKVRLGKRLGALRNDLIAELEEIESRLKEHEAELAAARRPPGSLLAELEEKVKRSKD